LRRTGAVQTDLAGLAVLFSRAILALAGVCPVRQPKARQRHAGEPDAEFLQRVTTCHGLDQALSEFIEFVSHTFPLVF
jgi:hypothetical protein